MPGPARLTELQLLCGSPEYDSGQFYDARILACHTTLDSLTATYDDNYDGNAPDTVMAASVLDIGWVNGQWGGLVFDVTFDYNGVDNLLLEIRWNGDDGRAVYARGFYPSGGPRVLDGYSLTNPQGTLRAYCNCLRIYYQQVGLGEAPPAGPRRTVRCSPNPFRGSVAIEADGPARVYGPNGRLVRVLTPENGRCFWDGSTALGQDAGLGVFLVAARAGVVPVLRVK